MGYGMNDLPSDWSEQLQSVYPKRSGPSGWRSMKLMLALRRALFDSTWEQIIDGCKNYQKYCQAGGIEGSSFVQAPTRYIEDGSYLETFTHQAVPTKEEAARAETKARSADRMARAVHAGGLLREPLAPMPGECVEAFETRIRMQAVNQPRGAGSDGNGERQREPGMGAIDPARSGEVSQRISSLTNRMRIAK
jgi:hypothetical protein